MCFTRLEWSSLYKENIMLREKKVSCDSQCGTTLIEVLVTILLLSFGLLGLASLQSKVQILMVESFQRAQATLILNDISERISANRPNATSYVTVAALGTGDSQPADCTTLAIGAVRDLCEWSNSLKGASEQKSSANVGAMQGGRGCIAQVQAPDPSPGVCAPAIYQATVVWQGLHQTAAPNISVGCGVGLYGAETYRRAISSRIAVGLTDCN